MKKNLIALFVLMTAAVAYSQEAVPTNYDGGAFNTNLYYTNTWADDVTNGNYYVPKLYIDTNDYAGRVAITNTPFPMKGAGVQFTNVAPGGSEATAGSIRAEFAGGSGDVATYTFHALVGGNDENVNIAVPTAVDASNAVNLAQMNASSLAAYVTTTNLLAGKASLAGDTFTGEAKGIDAVSTNAFITKSQFLGSMNGNLALRFTANRNGTYTNGIEPTSQVYIAKAGEYGVMAILTNTIAATGQYGCVQIYTNQGYYRVPAQDVSIDVWASENGAGSTIGKWEFYWYDSVRQAMVEYGEGGRTYTLDTGATPIEENFAIQVAELNTNNLCYPAVRFKWLSGAQGTILVGTGTNYLSHFAFSVSSDVLLDGYATEADVNVATNSLSHGNWGFTIPDPTNATWNFVEVYPDYAGVATGVCWKSMGYSAGYIGYVANSHTSRVDNHGAVLQQLWSTGGVETCFSLTNAHTADGVYHLVFTNCATATNIVGKIRY